MEASDHIEPKDRFDNGCKRRKYHPRQFRPLWPSGLIQCGIEQKSLVRQSSDHMARPAPRQVFILARWIANAERVKQIAILECANNKHHRNNLGTSKANFE